MSTKTTTKVAHYYVQKQRRAEFIDSWRENHRTVVALEDVQMQDTSRRMRRGVYVGADGGRPTRAMDATAHEIDPGTVSTVHRHSWDAMMFCVAGRPGQRSTASGSTGGPATRCTCPPGAGTGTATKAAPRRAS